MMKRKSYPATLSAPLSLAITDHYGDISARHDAVAIEMEQNGFVQADTAAGQHV